MIISRIRILVLALLTACGQQLVEFPLGDAGAGGADAPIGITFDAPLADARPGVDGGAVADGAAGIDALSAADAAVAIVDARPAIDAAGSIDATTGPPMVVSTSPSDQAMNVSVNRKITITFNKPMAPLTINDTSILLAQGATSIGGSVMYDDATHVATFTPMFPLGAGLTYTGTVTTGVMDESNQAMAQRYDFMFTVGACGLDPIVLLSAAHYAALAGATVTNTGATLITGDVGVSPGSEITGFPPGVVVGALDAMNGASAQGIADLSAAYNDAHDLVLCPVSIAGNLGTLTLTPGLYKSTSTLGITSGDLTLDALGDPGAIFIFQIQTSFNVDSSRKIFLVNRAQASNVFWQVGSSATIGTGAVMVGTFMADQSISLATGASLNGRALAHIGGVTLDSNAIVVPIPIP